MTTSLAPKSDRLLEPCDLLRAQQVTLASVSRSLGNPGCSLDETNAKLMASSPVGIALSVIGEAGFKPDSLDATTFANANGGSFSLTIDSPAYVVDIVGKALANSYMNAYSLRIFEKISLDSDVYQIYNINSLRNKIAY